MCRYGGVAAASCGYTLYIPIINYYLSLPSSSTMVNGSSVVRRDRNLAVSFATYKTSKTSNGGCVHYIDFKEQRSKETPVKSSLPTRVRSQECVRKTINEEQNTKQTTGQYAIDIIDIEFDTLGSGEYLSSKEKSKTSIKEDGTEAIVDKKETQNISLVEERSSKHTTLQKTSNVIASNTEKVRTSISDKRVSQLGLRKSVSADFINVQSKPININNDIAFGTRNSRDVVYSDNKCPKIEIRITSINTSKSREPSVGIITKTPSERPKSDKISRDETNRKQLQRKDNELEKQFLEAPVKSASMSKSAKPAAPPGESSSESEYESAYSYQNEDDNEQQFQARERLCKYVMDDIIGGQHVFKGPWGITPVTYVDYVASAKPLHCIEDYIQDHVLPMYANTHTEVNFTAQQTTLFRDEARAIIKQCVNASEDDAVIFCGSGSTSAVNKLIAALNLGAGNNPLVLLGPYEHHSNMLPWMQIPGVKVVRIRPTPDGRLDINHLASELQKTVSYFHRRKHIIGSFSAGSNVTGILTDVNAVCAIMHKYNGLAFFDYACVAPYVNIDMNPHTVQQGNKEKAVLTYKDAIFISTHKFLGGPGTPGLLIAKKHCFRSHAPHNLGGGTVQYVRREKVSYRPDIEDREEGGTPAIIESIRAGLVFKLKETFTAAFIMTKEEDMLRRAKVAWTRNETLVILGNLHVPRLPIFPILIYNFETGRFLHHDFVAMVFNDLFGLQVRSGCACAGPYSMDLLGMDEKIAQAYEDVVVKHPSKENETTNKTTGKSDPPGIVPVLKPGYVRLNLPYFFSDDTFNFVVKAVEMVADHAWKLLYLYDFDTVTGKWYFKKGKKLPNNKKHLLDVTFDSGQMEIREGLHEKLLNQKDNGRKAKNKSVHKHTDGVESTSRRVSNAGSKPASRKRSDTRIEASSSNIAFEERQGDSDTEETSYSLLDMQDTKSYMEVLKRAKEILNPKAESIELNFGYQMKSQLMNHKLRWFMLPEEALRLLRGGIVEQCPPEKLPFLPTALAVKLGLESDKVTVDRGEAHHTAEITKMFKFKTVPTDDTYTGHGPKVPWVE